MAIPLLAAFNAVHTLRKGYEMKNPNVNPENHTATVLVLEAIAMMMLMAGATKDDAIEGASRLFSAAFRETELFKLESAMRDGD